MTGIVVILIVSWLLLYLIEKRGINSLGFTPVPKRLGQFAAGFFFFGFVNLFILYSETLLRPIEWQFNDDFRVMVLLDSFGYHLRSAVSEDLVFRGALLYILIKRIGTTRALLISSTAFGVFHWFSFGMFGGGIVPMVYVFILTGLMGYAWAFSFAQTKSVFLGLGFHLGWNFTSTFFQTTVPYGELLYHARALPDFTGLMSLLFPLAKVMVPPTLAWLFVRVWFPEPAAYDPAGIRGGT